MLKRSVLQYWCLTSIMMLCSGCPEDPVTQIRIEPALATVTAGEKPVTLSAVLENLKGSSNNINWTLAGLGAIAPLKGTTTSYTPPKAVPSSTVATISATLAGTISSTTITVNPLDIRVSFYTPKKDIYTNGDILIQAAIDGEVPDKVEILKNGKIMAEIEAPLYLYQWNTKNEFEGEYVIAVRAIKGNSFVESETRKIIIDKTPPIILSTNQIDLNNLWVKGLIEIVFSEPISSSSVTLARAVQIIYKGSLIDLEKDEVALSEDLRTLRIQLKHSRQNSLSIDLSALGDLAGNPVAQNTLSELNYPYWQQPGGNHPLNIDMNNSGFSPSVGVDNNGYPIVTWSEQSPSGQRIFVKQWDGTAWKLLGSSLNVADFNSTLSRPSLVVDSHGKPIVTWNENGTIRCKIWDGVSWNLMGSELGFVGNFAFRPTISLDTNDNPIVAFIELINVSHYRVFVKRWDGSSWLTLGEAINNNLSSDITEISMTIDANNHPIVSWIESDNVFVKTWDGNSWNQLGSGVLNLSNSKNPSIDIDKNGNVFVSYNSFSAQFGYQIYIKHWSGVDWNDFGKLSEDYYNKNIEYSSIKLTNKGEVSIFRKSNDNQPYFTLEKWNGNSWIGFNRINFNGYNQNYSASIRDPSGNLISEPSFVLDFNDNPIIAWQSKSLNTEFTAIILELGINIKI